LFFKIESWIFQHLFEIEVRKTSQDFNSFSSFRQLLFSFFLSVVWLSWNFVKFHEILFQTDAESFSFLSWKIKKSYSYKKYCFGRCQYQNKQALFTDSIFREDFDYHYLVLPMPLLIYVFIECPLIKTRSQQVLKGSIIYQLLKVTLKEDNTHIWANTYLKKKM
jgi:hypothetical protein